MRRYYVFIALLLVILGVEAQRVNIIGTVKDKESGEKLMFANCMLQYKTDTNGIYKGETTDKEGRFIFQKIKKRDLILKISYVGYKTYRQEISSSQFLQGQTIDLGEISMQVMDDLEEVQIVAQRKRIEIDDDKMMELVDSIKDHGVIEPAVVFINEDGNYEMIAGHRRKRACELAGIETIPIIVKNINRDEATILMGESNLHSREEILPSEKAFTYKKMLDAMKRQAGRPGKNNLRPVGTNLTGQRSDEILATEIGESARQIQRYICLTNLIPELLDLVDQKRISLRPAVEISYLDSTQQKAIFNYYKTKRELDIDENGIGNEKQAGVSPSLAQAKLMREEAKDNKLDEARIEEILNVTKPNQKEKIVIKDEKVMKYAKGLTPLQFQDKILRALDYYDKHMAKEQQKDTRSMM